MTAGAESSLRHPRAAQVKQYWQHFRANEVEEEQYEDLNDYLDEDFEPIWEDEDEWLEKFSDWYEEDEDYPEGEEEEEEYIEEDAVEPARPQNKLDLGQDEYDYEEEEEEEVRISGHSKQLNYEFTV